MKKQLTLQLELSDKLDNLGSVNNSQHGIQSERNPGPKTHMNETIGNGYNKTYSGTMPNSGRVHQQYENNT